MSSPSTEKRMLQVLESERQAESSKEALRSLLFGMFIVALIVNVANVYQSQKKIINFFKNSATQCATNTPTGVSGWRLAFILEYPFLRYFIGQNWNSNAPLFVYYAIMTKADSPIAPLTPTMMCGNNYPAVSDTRAWLKSATASASAWQSDELNPFRAVIPYEAPLVQSFVKNNSLLLTNLFQGGLIAVINSLENKSTNDLWVYIFVDPAKPADKKPKVCDKNAFAGGVLSSGLNMALGGAFIGGPLGAVIGAVAGAGVGALSNENKVTGCT